MRGRPNDPVAARQKARAHTKHVHTCVCGKKCRGNGGWASHKRSCAKYKEHKMGGEGDETKKTEGKIPSMDFARMIPKDAREVYVNSEGEPIAFCPVDSIGIVDIVRMQFFNLNKDRLAALEARAEVKTTDAEKFCVVCIDVDDKTWTELVDILMPGHDWDAYRARGETPVARGVVPRELIVDLVKDAYPAAGKAPDGIFSAIFAAGGVSYIEARKA